MKLLNIATLCAFTCAASVLAQNQGSANQLLRSGTMEQFANTPIVTAGGVRFSVGVAGQQLFSETDRVIDSLTAASQGGNSPVSPGWTVTSQFEEWTDRLVLRKAVTFNMLDGAAVNALLSQDGATFADGANVVEGEGQTPTQSELLQKATTFIANGGHLQLYPEAQTAATQGAQALLDELANDRGPVTITETILFGRVIPRLTDVSEAQTAVGDRLALEPGDVTVPIPTGPALNRLGSAMVQRAPLLEAQVALISELVSSSTYSADMLNGFTIGEDWSRSVEYERSWIYFKTSAFATFGLGLRIPWKATVKTAPRYIASDLPDRTPFEASISIETVNADAAFYRSVGLPSDRVYDGQELVLRAGAGITLKVRLFGETLINRGRNNPLVGRDLDLGSNFDPPMNGASASAGSPTLYYEDTGLAWQNWAVGIGCDMRANVSLIGEGFTVDTSPHNAWLINPHTSSHTQATWSMPIPQQNTPRTFRMAVDDNSSPQISRNGQRYYKHGILFSNASYEADMDIVPGARLRATLKLSNILSRLSNLNLSTPWLNLFTANFNLPELEPHPGTNDEIEAWEYNRRFLPPVEFFAGHVRRQLEQSAGNPSSWSVNLTEETPLGNGVLKEILPEGFSLGQIIGGGVYDPATRTITWQIQAGNPPAQVGYTINGAADQTPKLLGQWQAQGQTSPSPTLTASQQDAGDANLPLLVNELSKRPTMQQLIDARPGSVIITAGPDNNARIRLKMETSENLQNWTVTPESQANPLEVVQPLTGNKRFFRFKLSD